MAKKGSDSTGWQARIDAFLADPRMFRGLIAGLLALLALLVVAMVVLLFKMVGGSPAATQAPETTQPVLVLPTSEYTPMPPPDPAAIEAEIGLLGVEAAADRSALRVTVSIYNYNTTAFTLNPQDVRLALPGGEMVYPAETSPALPRDFQPGETVEFTFTFPMPAGPLVEFQLLSVAFDLEGY